MGGRLSLKRLTKKWQGFALVDINLDIEDGEYFVLVGPTGSGKTLLLETINGFHKVFIGKILHDGKDITELSPHKRDLGYVSQFSNLSDKITVRKNIEFILKRRDILDKRKKVVDGIINMLGLEDMENRLTITLSGGEKRKVALARALVLEPKTLLLDEPFSNLDITMKSSLRDELKMIHKYLDLTVVHVTHDQAEALGLANRLGVIKNGKLVNIGTIEEIFENPKDEYAARFLGYENIFSSNALTKVRIQDKILRTLKPPNDKEFLVGIHNDQIGISKLTPENTDENIFHAVVKEYSNLGPRVTLIVDIGLDLKLNISKSRFIEQKLDIDKKIWVYFNNDSLKILTSEDDISKTSGFAQNTPNFTEQADRDLD
jgi:molybdate/tungstate transport system ATP-binding protein